LVYTASREKIKDVGKVRKQFRRKMALLITVVMAVSLLSACGKKIEDYDAKNTVLITVGESKIYLDRALFNLKYQQNYYEKMYAAYGMESEDMWSNVIGNIGSDVDGMTMEESLKYDVLEELEMVQILIDHADEYDVSLTDEEKEQIKSDAKTYLESDHSDDPGLIEFLGVDEELLTQYLTDYELAGKVQRAAIDAIEVDTDITDEEARQASIQYVYFSVDDTTEEDGSKTPLTEEEKADIKADAQTVIDKVKQGEEMEAVAEELGYTANTTLVGKDSSQDAFEEAALALQDGEVSDIVETDSGYVVMKCLTALDREATDEAKEEMIETERTEKFSLIYRDWKEATDITVDEKLWAKVKIEYRGVTSSSETGDTDLPVDPADLEREEESSLESTTSAE
jgi:foldase protein PrsA